MIFLDASAAVGILAREPDEPRLTETMMAAEGVAVSALVEYDTVAALARIKRRAIPEARAVMTRFLADHAARWIPIDAEIAAAALTAFDRYGKGRHRAALNMGDCFSYACARVHRLPLLYKGEDFALTDIEAA